MKRLLVILFALALLLACQPTPEEEYVSHKDTETMLGEAVSSDTTTLRDMVRPPESMHVTRTVEAPNTRFRITIDADVVLPDTDAIPVVHVRHGAFDDDTMSRILKYVGNDSGMIETFPKSYYQGIIDHLMDMRERGELDKYDSVEELDEAILRVVQDKDAAPDEAVFSARSPMDDIREKGFFSFEGFSDRGTVFMLIGSRLPNEDNCLEYRYDIDNSHVLDLQIYSIGGNLLDNWLPAIERGEIKLIQPRRTEQDARAYAEQLIENLGLSDTFTCVRTRLAPLAANGELTTDIRINGCPACWEVLFTRCVNGVNVTYTDDDFSNDMDGSWEDSASYAAQWHYERIAVYVDDEGLNGMFLYGPYELLEITTPAAKILSLDEVLPIFDRMMTYKYTEFENGHPWIKDDPSVTVTEIRLGLTRVREKNNLGTAYLVPTYTFFGVTDENPNYPPHGCAGTEAVLVINAIDGTAIDLGKGY